MALTFDIRHFGIEIEIFEYKADYKRIENSCAYNGIFYACVHTQHQLDENCRSSNSLIYIYIYILELIRVSAFQEKLHRKSLAE